MAEMTLDNAKAMLRRVIGKNGKVDADSYIYIDDRFARHQFEAAKLLVDAGYLQQGIMKEYQTPAGEDDQYSQLRFYFTDKVRELMEEGQDGQ